MPEKTLRACILAFVTAGTTLFVQVLVHRMVAAKLLNNYAFFVISLTMLGFGVSGVVLSRWLLARFLRRLNDAIAVCAAGFALTLLGASVVFYRADGGAQMAVSRPEFVADFLRVLPLALLFAVPFAFCGLILGALLAAPDLPTRRIYFFDLIGSGLGAIVVLPAISRIGVEGSTLLACAAQLALVAVVARPSGRAARLVLAVAFLGTMGMVWGARSLLVMRYPEGSMLWQVETCGPKCAIESILWDPVARIEVSRIPPPNPKRMPFPLLIGNNAAFHERFRRMLTQNNFAFTFAVDYDGTPESLRGIEETIYAAAYQATSIVRPRTLVIGVGGGFDVLTALAFDATEVVGVEVNAATMHILERTYRDYFKHWVLDPRVRLVHGEGREFLASHADRFDVIQLSGVDSYSGTPAAAHVFSENYLYTAEAFDLYLSRLTDEGILNVMRLEMKPPREMLKALTTAVAALRRAGVREPAQHIAMLTAKGGNFTALLVKKTPFHVAERERLRRWTEASDFFRLSGGARLNSTLSDYQFFLNLGDEHLEEAFVAGYPFDVYPVDDDRPFFFRYAFWWHIFPADPTVWRNVPVMEYSVILLAALVGLVARTCIGLPLRKLGRSPLLGMRRYAVFFAATAVGYMAVEIALLQKFGLVLGHPNYALSVVLAALLVSSGLGSLFSISLVQYAGGLRFVPYVLAGIILAEYFVALRSLPLLFALPFVFRVAIVFALVAPIGLCLGTFLPTALEQLKASVPALVPWAWGINGIFSVLAPIAGIAVSMTYGMNALLLGAIPIYMIAGWVLPVQSQEQADAAVESAVVAISEVGAA